MVLPREKTKMCPLELRATPATSPKYKSDGSLRKSGTESNGISSGSCAGRNDAANRNSKRIEYLIGLRNDGFNPAETDNSRNALPGAALTHNFASGRFFVVGRHQPIKLTRHCITQKEWGNRVELVIYSSQHPPQQAHHRAIFGECSLMAALVLVLP